MRWAILGLLAAGAAAAADMPVLVELFTSEGCSSCPPADALLEVLDRTQPVAGVEAIVVSEHVDYWNRIGWVDPYSSPAFSRRQEAYANRFRTSGPYTPQMVVDGTAEFVGNDAKRAASAIAAAGRGGKVAVRLTAGGEGNVHVEVDRLPASYGRRTLDVVAVRADEARVTDVLGGENRGRRLRHVAVARGMELVGSVSAASAFTADLPARGAARLIVFVQAKGVGAVAGAAVIRLGGATEGADRQPGSGPR